MSESSNPISFLFIFYLIIGTLIILMGFWYLERLISEREPLISLVELTLTFLIGLFFFVLGLLAIKDHFKIKIGVSELNKSRLESFVIFLVIIIPTFLLFYFSVPNILNGEFVRIPLFSFGLILFAVGLSFSNLAEEETLGGKIVLITFAAGLLSLYIFFVIWFMLIPFSDENLELDLEILTIHDGTIRFLLIILDFLIIGFVGRYAFKFLKNKFGKNKLK